MGLASASNTHWCSAHLLANQASATLVGALHASRTIMHQQHTQLLCHTPPRGSYVNSTRRCSAHLQDDQMSAARAGALHTSKIVKATPHGVGPLLHCRKPSATM